jgi:hypothetical protein
MTLCEFRIASEEQANRTVVCVHCGRRVILPGASNGNIIAQCRGASETRWQHSHFTKGNTVSDRPGTALKSLLAKIGITAAPNCSCQRHAAEMDARGCDWCEQNLDTIVGWLREEATKRGLPFLDAAGRLLVRRAIRNARRAAAN